MLRSIWKENVYLLFRQRNLALIFAFTMLFTNLVLGIKLYNHNQKVIIVPAYIKQSFWAEGESVSKEYLEEMTIFFASLMLNATPESLSYQRNAILKYVSPEFHSDLNNKLIEEEEKMRKQELSTSFRAKEVQVDLEKGEVIIKGILTQYVSGNKVAQEMESYKASFGYNSGILLLKGFEVSNG